MEKNSFFSPAEIDSSDINSEKPTIALSGVRISWLILAINALFFLFAASASFANASLSPASGVHLTKMQCCMGIPPCEKLPIYMGRY